MAGAGPDRISVEEAQRLYNPFAALADGDVPTSGEGPLSGIDVSVKDIVDVAGFPTRWGSRLLADAPSAAADAEAVRRLRAAGARIVAKTTTTEFAHSPLGVSPLTGTTLNPWNSRFTCGGSSAGAGVAVATGATPVSLATDAGCSTRLPAALTGTVGMKPTLGRIPHERLPEGFANIVHLGIVGQTVSLVRTTLAALCGPFLLDPMSLGHPPLGGERPRGLAGKRVLLWLRAGNQRVHGTVESSMGEARGRLERLGATVVEQDYGLANPQDAWAVLQQTSWASRLGRLSAEERGLLSPTMRAGVDAGLALSARDLNAALTARTGFFRAVQGVFGAGFDFILTPCASAPAVPADQPIDEPFSVDGSVPGELRREWVPYLSLFDLSGHPAIALPAGIDGNGVPLGMQLVAPWGRDEALLDAAAEWESEYARPQLGATLLRTKKGVH